MGITTKSNGRRSTRRTRAPRRPATFYAVHALTLALDKLAPRISARLAMWLFTRPRRHKRPPWERRLLVTARHCRLPSGGVAHSWGRGKTVLLLHGWEGRGSQLGAFVQPLVALGYQVVALDARAHGDAPFTRTHPLDFATVLEDAARHFDNVASVVGHSLGAVAAAIALDRGMAAQSVVLVAGPSSLSRVLDRFSRRIRIGEAASKHLRELVENYVGASLESLDLTSIGQRVTTPALVIHDPNDKQVSYRHALRIVHSWPNARLEPAPSRGHYRVLRSSAVIDAAVEFIKEQSATE